jgi:MoxR-like ATPase
MGEDNMSKKESQMPQIDPDGLVELLTRAIPQKLPIMLVGMPGIGKTDIPTHVVENVLGYDMAVYHPVISDPTDYKGMPWVVQKDGEYFANFIPFNDLQRIIDATEPLVVFFDDLGQAPPTVQAAIMQLLLARKINDHKVSDHVTFMAASNRKEDMAAVTGMLEPVKSRFCTILELTTDQEAWDLWAAKAGIEMKLRAFLRFKPELLCSFKPKADFTQSPIPRTIHNLDKLIKLNLSDSVKYVAYIGAVGEGFTKEFTAFERMYDSLTEIEKIPVNPMSVDVPTKPDVCHAIIGSLVQKAKRNNIHNIMKWVNRTGMEYQAVFVSDIENMKPELCETTAMVEWQVENGDLHI